MCLNVTSNHNNPFYNLSSKKRLSVLLGCSVSFLHKFKNSRNNYITYTTTKKSNPTKTRPIEEPKNNLKNIHKKIKTIFDKINYPEYLHSGRKRHSYITNAKYHCSNQPIYCVTMDLASFYQKGKKTFLANSLINDFLMAKDIAWLLSDIMTIPNIDNTESYFPTGSPISQLAIYFAYKKTFDDIFNFSKIRGIKFSLYVDDLTFSSTKKISKSFVKSIIKRFEHIGLEVNHEKTKYFSKNSPKIITGCVVKKTNIFSRNSKKKEILDLLQNSSTELENKKIFGKILAQQQIEPLFFETTKIKIKKQIKNPNTFQQLTK